MTNFSYMPKKRQYTFKIVLFFGKVFEILQIFYERVLVKIVKD